MGKVILAVVVSFVFLVMVMGSVYADDVPCTPPTCVGHGCTSQSIVEVSGGPVWKRICTGNQGCVDTFCSVPEIDTAIITDPIYDKASTTVCTGVATSEYSDIDKFRFYYLINGQVADLGGDDWRDVDCSGTSCSKTLGPQDAIPSELHVPGDDISCRVEVYGVDGGSVDTVDLKISDEVTVENRIPTFSGISLPETHYRPQRSIFLSLDDPVDGDLHKLDVTCCKGVSCDPKTNNDFCEYIDLPNPYVQTCNGVGASGTGTQTINCIIKDPYDFATTVRTTSYTINNRPTMTGFTLKDTFATEWNPNSIMSVQDAVDLDGDTIQLKCCNGLACDEKNNPDCIDEDISDGISCEVDGPSISLEDVQTRVDCVLYDGIDYSLAKFSYYDAINRGTYFKDDNGDIIAWLGNSGDFDVKDSVVDKDGDCSNTPAEGSFKLDNSGDITIYIEPEGDFCYEGTLIDNQAECSTTAADEWVFQNEAEDIVAVMDVTSGDICLVGSYNEGVDFTLN